MILARVITGLNPGASNALLTLCAAVGVVGGYALRGATYFLKTLSDPVDAIARRWTLIALPVTVICALVQSAATLRLSLIGTERWHQHGVLGFLCPLGLIAALAVACIAGTTWIRH